MTEITEQRSSEPAFPAPFMVSDVIEAEPSSAEPPSSDLAQPDGAETQASGSSMIVLNTDDRGGIELHGKGFVVRDGIPTDMLHEMIERLKQEVAERAECLERFLGEWHETVTRDLSGLLGQFVEGATVEHLGDNEDHAVFLIMVPEREHAVRIADILSQAVPFLAGIRAEPDGIEAGGGCIRVLTRKYTKDELRFLNLA